MRYCYRWEELDISVASTVSRCESFLLLQQCTLNENEQGLTLVISPLIALMKDQVDVLVSRGVKAASLDSTQGMERSSWIKDEVLNGNMKILFVAPERYEFPKT